MANWQVGLRNGGNWDWRDEMLGANSGDDAFYINTLWGVDLCWQAELAFGRRCSELASGAHQSIGYMGYRIGLDQARGAIGLYQMIPGQEERWPQERPAEIAAAHGIQ
ncbi:MAG: hypothetical protein R2911_19175 [Caldilineaceae bacterium]